MSGFLAVLRQEARRLFLSPGLLFAAFFFVLLDSFVFYLTAAGADATAEFEPLALAALFTALILLPLPAAQSLASERAEGTLETLLTAPIGPGRVLLAKFAGLWLFALAYLSHGLAYAFWLSRNGNLDWNATVAAFSLLALFAAFALSLGLAFSAPASSPAAAAAGSAALLILLAAAGGLDPYSGTGAAVFHRLGFIPHAKRWISGELDSGGLSYFLVGTILFLFLAWLALTAEREGGEAAAPARPGLFRSGRAWTLAAALAAAVLAVNLGWLSARPFPEFSGGRSGPLAILFGGWRLDVSDDGRHTPPAPLAGLLDSLQGPLTATCLLPEAAESGGVALADGLRRLLERCRARNPLLRIAWIDPETRPGAAESFLQGREAPGGGDASGWLVLDYLGRRRILPAAGLAVPPDWRERAAGGKKWVFDGENQLARAISDLIDPRVPNLFFSYGHNELSLSPGVRRDLSASRLAAALARDGLRIRQCAVSAGQPIPPECDLLAVASPGIPFQPAEAEEIRRYLENGGRLLLLAPAAGEQYRAAGDALADLAHSLGGSYRDDLVEDPLNNDDGQARIPLGTGAGIKSEASPEEREAGFSFPLARSLRDNPGSGENGWTSERLIHSFTTSEAADFAGGRRAGPFTLVYRAWKKTGAGEARAAVVASGRLGSDSYLARGANEALLLGLARWLAGRDELPAEPPAARTDRRLGPGIRPAGLWLAAAAPPLFWLGLGFAAWRRGRR
ncbi:MAG: Gldg family protein [Planctomycetota bacterium]|nr:Gldg family protein [Planctomycetota bacterium]